MSEPNHLFDEAALGVRRNPQPKFGEANLKKVRSNPTQPQVVRSFEKVSSCSTLTLDAEIDMSSHQLRQADHRDGENARVSGRNFGSRTEKIAFSDNRFFGNETDEGDAAAPFANQQGTAPIHRYVDGNAYRLAAGRNAPRAAVVDSCDWRFALAVIDLRHERPKVSEFVRIMVREMRIREYDNSTIKAYRDAITSLLRWSGRLPHEMNRELVRQYLEYLVDSCKGWSLRSVHLSAIRTIFDKMCFLDITLGLCTPRRGKHLPIVLSKDEVCRLIEAAISLRDKLLLGLMYATGIRVSEVVRLRWRDIEMDRNVISIRSGKGNVDRQVMLPNTYRKMFTGMKQQCSGETYLFPSEDPRRGHDPDSRYLSTRTVQRVMASAVKLAGIGKKATPHALRHSFATHSFEEGCDIRRIQKILGHVHLETTTIYVKVAKPSDPTKMPSPIDTIGISEEPPRNASEPALVRPKIHFRRFAGESATRVTLEYTTANGPVYLTGGRTEEIRRGYWTLHVPLIDDWREECKRLGRTERMQLQNAELYEWLRLEVGRRLSSVSAI